MRERGSAGAPLAAGQHTRHPIGYEASDPSSSAFASFRGACMPLFTELQLGAPTPLVLRYEPALPPAPTCVDAAYLYEGIEPLTVNHSQGSCI